MTPEEIAPEAGRYRTRGEAPLLRRLGLESSVAIEVSGWDVVESYVEAGLGVAVLSRLVVSERPRVSVVTLDAGPGLRRTYGLFTRRGEPLSWAAERFVEVMRIPPPRARPRLMNAPPPIPRRPGRVE